MDVNFGLVELLFVFGVGLAIAVWELFSVRREVKRGRADRKDNGPPP